MVPVGPVLVAHLMAPLHAELVALLRQLPPDAWNRTTSAGAWRVRDVAAHLLDVILRKLSVQRDGYLGLAPDRPISGWADLVAFLDGLNAEWVRASKRLSPRVLTDVLEPSGAQLAAILESLDPHAPAPFAVSWAGEAHSANWFDIAREYTEHWHHQQQIREAVGAPGLVETRWLAPLIDTGVRVLPRTYADVHAPPGTTLAVGITGAAGGDWSLVRSTRAWELFEGAGETPAARVLMDEDAAWRFLFKAMTAEQARARARLEGDVRLAEVLFRSIALMADPASSSS